jgi:DNA helicase II / ATP-dependent DNA helicase PcrA
MRLICFLRCELRIPVHREHSSAMEIEAAILAAEIICLLLQPERPKDDFSQFVRLVCNFYEGRGGDTPAES